MAQLMPLPLTVSCFSEIQIGFTFLVPAHLGSPGKRAVKRVCVSVWCHDRSETWFTTLCILIRFQTLVSVSLKFETVISAKDKLARCLGFYSRLFCAPVVLLVICRLSRAAFSFAFALSVYRCFAITLQRFKCHPVVCRRLGNKRNAISIDAAKRFSTFYLFFSCFNVL